MARSGGRAAQHIAKCVAAIWLFAELALFKRKCALYLPLEHIIDIILEVKAQTYSFEAANVRHEHEWRVW